MRPPTSRYVHPSEDIVLAAMAKLDGHKIGHNRNLRGLKGVAPRPLSIQKQKRKMVDVTGIEPATPCLQSKLGNTMWLILLAFTYVT